MQRKKHPKCATWHNCSHEGQIHCRNVPRGTNPRHPSFGDDRHARCVFYDESGPRSQSSRRPPRPRRGWGRNQTGPKKNAGRRHVNEASEGLDSILAAEGDQTKIERRNFRLICVFAPRFSSLHECRISPVFSIVYICRFGSPLQKIKDLNVSGTEEEERGHKEGRHEILAPNCAKTS